MKIFITGSYGQVGTELTMLADRSGWQFRAVDRDHLDITDGDEVEAALSAFAPDAVINAAAYTAVDKAESDKKTAFSVNRDGPVNLARACENLGIPFVHYSTDYVFDGSKDGPYSEDDPVAPLGVYGESKLAGEQAVQQSCSRHLILRTSWVFSSHGNNFVKTMLRLGAEREVLGIVADQFGKPTSAAEIARVTFELLSTIKGKEQWGIYHLAQPEVTNWCDFAQAVFTEAGSQGMPLKIGQVKAIATADYPTPARRPANSELDCSRLQSLFGISIRPWRESLADVIKELKRG